MTEKVSIKSKCLKDLLSLFDKHEELENLSLGDTWHPSSGFVDEKILNGKNKILDILEFDYNFVGLGHFKAELGTMKIELFDEETEDKKEEYKVQGTAKDLQILKNRVIEENANEPGKFEITIDLNYKKT